jgi:diaminopimelate epimerase
MDTRDFPLEIDGRLFDASAVSVGNPHCVLFVPDAERAPVSEVGPKIERHPLFPERTNVEFVSVAAPDRLRMRVWERGVGITRACGTGACAAAVAAHRRRLVGRKVEIVLDGGILAIEWREDDGHIVMTGGASLAFSGEIDLGQLEQQA